MQRLELPSESELVANFKLLSETIEPVRRYSQATAQKSFVADDGRKADLERMIFSPEKAALLAFLCQHCEAELSIEIGFGMGSSATVILGTRRSTGRNFEHLILDPWGISRLDGEIVQDYLEQEFGPKFQRIWERSEIALGQILKTRGQGKAGLIFIDGGHQFENVMTDFALSDLLCAHHGYIVLDDAAFPAIETVLNYIRANRPDYQIAYQPVPDIAVLRKVAPDARSWSSFKPFEVPDRSDWTSVNHT
ncbi:class I SAM-dependent methyltransferase [Roseibium sp. HPY-6]|uniref:class I SAM-dependent methyltransferase n=1 Tax=Roseibium sp. HPY-6 TaxID=3229852 RepID=UPI0033902695